MVSNCHVQLPNLAVDQLIKRYKTARSKERWMPIYQTLLDDAQRLAEPAAICQEFPLGEMSDLQEWLPAQTQSVILAVTTLGKVLDDHVNDLTNTDLISAVILNEITLAMINAMTRQLHANIRSETLDRGLKAGAAYRPGVGRWPLSTQEVIFERIPAHEIGVSLDEFLMMRPVKSTSLIIPVLDKSADRS